MIVIINKPFTKFRVLPHFEEKSEIEVTHFTGSEENGEKLRELLHTPITET